MADNTMEANKKSAGPLLFSIIVLAAFILVLAFTPSRELFKAATAAHPFLMGFAKFALLATVGELLAIRLTKKFWSFPSGFFARAFVWGFLGMVIALMFKVYWGGVAYIIQMGFIPGASGPLLPAFLCSLVMNVTFAPTMMIFHKITDTAITMKYNGERLISLKNVVGNIDFKTLIGFTIAVTVPCFWIPAHTVSFMLPGEYQIIMAASLSIALGIILSLKKN
ncbi:MAG TPA: hypothetical protein VN381_03810 [Anaerovoracaceae bacterium]|nr:hypothetical protein [Anaerovoracaceae bacterium]